MGWEGQAVRKRERITGCTHSRTIRTCLRRKDLPVPALPVKNTLSPACTACSTSRCCGDSIASSGLYASLVLHNDNAHTVHNTGSGRSPQSRHSHHHATNADVTEVAGLASGFLAASAAFWAAAWPPKKGCSFFGFAAGVLLGIWTLGAARFTVPRPADTDRHWNEFRRMSPELIISLRTQARQHKLGATMITQGYSQNKVFDLLQAHDALQSTKAGYRLQLASLPRHAADQQTSDVCSPAFLRRNLLDFLDG